ncbi:leucine-rich repeat domain-containing protein [Weissella halotolerans]|nr:leucine-rich repeat domain-containing protein [Weissella halotolerans]
MVKKIWLALCVVLAVVMMSTVASPVQAAILAEPRKISEIFPDDNFAQTVANWWTNGNVDAEVNQNYFDGYKDKPLYLAGKGISNLEGIQYFNNPTGLDLRDNNISDLGPIGKGNFTKITYVDLLNNKVSSLVPLATSGMNPTGFLGFENNQLGSLEGIENMTNLTSISIQDQSNTSGNQVSDLNPLANLTKLQKIWAKDNAITSLKPLANLNALQEAYFENNKLASIDGMQGKINLIKFSVMNNQVVDLDPLVDATRLQNLFVRYNHIESISVLNKLPDLIQLDATHNRISDISAINFVHQDDPNPALALSYQDIILPEQSYTTGTPLLVKNSIRGLQEEGILPPATFPGSSKITGVGNDEMYQVDPMTALQSGSYDANTETVAFDLSTGAKKAFYTFNSTSKHDGNFSGIVTIPLTEEFSKTNLSWEDTADKAITNKTLPPLDYNDRGVNTKFYWKDTDPNKTLAFKLTDKEGNEVAPLASVETGDGDKTGQYIAHDLQIPADKLTYGSQTFTVTVYDVTGGANHEVDHITLVVDVTGALRFVSAPAALDGGENKIISGTIQKRLEKATGDEPLVVTDSRQTKAPWALGLQIDQPFTAAGVVYNTQLPGVLNYLQNGVPTMVPDGNDMTQVYQQVTPVNERNISDDWNATNGPAVIVPGTKVSAVKYSATLTWTLMDTPLNE